MATKQKIFLYTSDIAAYIGQNSYDYVTPFERIWKRCDSNEYNRILNKQKEKVTDCNLNIEKLEIEKSKLNLKLDTKKITQTQYNNLVKTLDKNKIELKDNIIILEKNIDSIDLNQEQRLKKKLGQDTLNTLQSSSVETDNKKEQVTTVLENMNLSKEEKNYLKRETESFINKTHGTLKEDSAIEMYEKRFNVKLDTSQQFYKHQIYQDFENEWYICGKMDGLYISESEPSYIVEVKNRVNGFFTTLRDYEKTQIHMYMHMANVSIAKLVEKYKNKIRVTVIYKDDDYLKDVLEYLNIFITNFEMGFLKNDKLKEKFINSNSDDKKQILRRLYLNDITKTINKKIEETIVDADCLIDDLD
jgi:hypothetical protein